LRTAIVIQLVAAAVAMIAIATKSMPLTNTTIALLAAALAAELHGD
jgi:hypothetical protein